MKMRTAIRRDVLGCVLLLVAMLLAACSGTTPEQEAAPTATALPTALPTDVVPTADTSVTPQTDLSEDVVRQESTEDNATAEAPEPEPTQELAAVVDPQRGLEIFVNGGESEWYTADLACVTCHSLDGSVSAEDDAGPSLLGIADRAAGRVPGLSAEEYLRESIMTPAEFLAPTYRNGMSRVAAEYLTPTELEDLIAFLLTLKGDTVSAVTMEAMPEPDIDLGMPIDTEGNATRGEKLTAVVRRCVACHVDEAISGYGPRFSSTDELPPIRERGAVRIADPGYAGQATTNEEYLIESIFLPAAYVVPGEWEERMPHGYHEFLTPREVADIVAWLNTFE